VEQGFAIANEGALVWLFDQDNIALSGSDWVEQAIYRVNTDGEATLFAHPDTALHEVLSVFQKMGIDPTHPPSCYTEAEHWMQNTGLDAPDLRDLESLPFVTIDNPDSRDLDQALYLEQTETGHRVLYALADAAYYVQAGSALFTESLRRGVTYYAPSFAAPMLPPSLSEGLVSLNPDVLRRALVFDIQLDARAEVTACNVYQARIRSRAKLSYQGVQAWFDDAAAGRTHDWDDLDYAKSLRLMAVIGNQRIALARERHVVEHNRTEIQVGIDKNNTSKFSLGMRKRNDVERYNEQISLLCNMEGAKILMQHERLSPEMQAVFRVHMPPVHQRVHVMREAVDAICDLHQLDGAWRWDGKQMLADYMDQLPDTLPRVRHAISRQVMLINQASEFSAEAGPHHALGVDGYARFSSPMREIAGIFTHKELLEAQGVMPAQPVAADEELRKQVIAIANASKKTQRKIEKSFQLHIVEQFLNDEVQLPEAQRPIREATVMGMRGTRIYVAVDGFALDLKIYAADLENRWGCKYEVTDTTASPSDDNAPTLRMGDTVKLQTASWDKKRKRFILDIVG